MKATAAHARVAHQGEADLETVVEQLREAAGREAHLDEGVRQAGADLGRRARVARVRLDDHGAAGGERRRGVAAGRGERQREVAGPEHDDGTEFGPVRAHVGLGEGRAARVAAIDPGLAPRFVADQVGEHPELAGGARQLAAQARLGEAGLAAGDVDQRVGVRVEAARRRAEQRLAARSVAQGAGHVGGPRGLRGRVHGGRVVQRVRGLERFAGARVDGA